MCSSSSSIPENFTRDLLRGDRPAVLVEADATDPAATSNAIGSLRSLLDTALQNDLKGPLAYLAGTPGPVDLRVHAHYNPEAITQYNIVPGLMGVVLTMTMVMITALAITRERERGTMENLLSMPTRPFEVLIGKIIPYILVGYIQVGLILLAAYFLFHVPMLGQPRSAACRGIAVHHREPGGGHHLLHAGDESAPGDADVVLLLSALDAALGLHVPLSRDAALGTADRRDPPAHALSADRPRHSAQGEWPEGDCSRVVADRGVRRGGTGDWRTALPSHPGLTNRRLPAAR